MTGTMTGTSGVAWALAMVMAGVSLCAGRLVVSRAEHAAEVVSVLMGVAAAGMLVGRLRVVPGGVWVLVFAVVGVWFGLRVAAGPRTGRDLTYLLGSVAMLYMLLYRPPGPGEPMPGMRMGPAPAAWPLAGLTLAVALFASAVWTLDRVSAGAGVTARVAGCCQAAVSITLGYMLVMML